MKNLILATLSFCLIQSSFAQGTGPYKRESKANVAQKIVHVVDNSTVGAVQTVIGATHVLVFAAMQPIPGAKEYGISPKMKPHNNRNSEVTQIRIDSDLPWFYGAYSLGLFQVNSSDGVEDHEGGHSVASAALGPLYLPTVAMSYLMESHGGSFFEEWADLEAEASPFMNTAQAQVGLGSTTINGKRRNVLVMKFAIEQRQVMGTDRVKTDKIFQWVNLNVLTPMVKKQSPDSYPTLVEFDLLSKRLNLVAENIDVYLGGDQSLRTDILMEQRYIHIENNPELKRFHMKALDWSVQYGVQYNLGKIVSVTPRVGVGASADIIQKGSGDFLKTQFQDKPIYTGSFSLTASLDVKVMDYANFKTEYKKEFYLNNDKVTTFSASVGNSIRDPFQDVGFIQYVDFSAGYKKKTYVTNTEVLKSNQWGVSVGLRF